MTLLAIDCSASLCAACVFEEASATERGRHVLDLGKGHAEHLMTVIDTALAAAGVGYGDLERVVVAVGPGSFTGIRVAVSAARGLALALSIPVAGVGTLEALAAEAHGIAGGDRILAALATVEDQVQAAGYDALGRVWHHPEVMTIERAAELAMRADATLAGTAAQRLAALLADRAGPVAAEKATADIAFYARLGAAKPAGGEKPKPLYLREPDAKPQAGFILPRAAGSGGC